MSESLPETFWSMIEGMIDEQGVYPQQLLHITDGELSCCSLMLDPPQIVPLAKKLVAQGAEELIFGLDRTTRPGQGTEFADVLTCAHYKDGEWRVGVINYQHEPRIVRDWDWNNEFWTEAVLYELGLSKTHPLLRGEARS